MSCLIEIEVDDSRIVLIGTGDGRIESYNFSNQSAKPVEADLPAGILHFWHQNNSTVYAITTDCTVLSMDLSPDNYSCECINNIHFGSVTGMTCFAQHPLLPGLLIYGGSDQSIRVAELALEGALTQLQSIRYHDGFLGQRLGPIGQVTWHPSRMIFAAITSDSFVSIYSSK